MSTELLPLLELGLSEAVALLNLGFSDYIAHIEFTLPGFLGMVRSDGIDLTASRAILLDSQPAGVALMARRGWTSRLAGMCLSPGLRGRGVGRAAMQMLLAEAAGRGEREMVLEVIESNTPGVRLYQGVGFRTERRLLSYSGEFPAPERLPEAAPEEMDVREAARWVSMYGLPNLPWQLSGESLAQSGPPSAAWRLDGACLVTSNPEAEAVAILSLVVMPEARRRGQAARLLGAVMARCPGRRWVVPALCPEEVGGFFVKMGFQPGSLAQLQMRAVLNG